VKESAFQRTLRFLLLIFIALSINRYIEYSFAADVSSYSFKHFLKYEIVQLVFSLIITAPFLLLRKSYRIYKVFLIPFWVYMGLEFLHVMMFQGYPNSATYFSIFSTNANESVEFISDYFGFELFFYLLLYAGGLMILNFFLKNLMKQHEHFAKVSYFSIISLSLAVFAFASFSKRLHPIGLKDVSVIKSFSSYVVYQNEKEKFIEIANQKIEFKILERKYPHEEIETHVIVIGESTSKHHMGLYEYGRKTNPKLSQRELVVFNHAKSPNAHTVPALEKVLTFKNRIHPNLGMENGSIIDLANQAGYETYWISNQAFSGEHETPISVIASKANHKVYTNAIGTTPILDEALIEPYTNALSFTKSKVIFVHLMGTHLSYKQRYSDAYDVFKDDFNLANMHWNEPQQTFINQYDNAVLYNDYVVNELLTELKKTNTISTFTYFSDHGDEVYDYRNFHGHSDVLLSKYMYDVPLLLWFSDTYKLKQSEQLTFLIYSPTSIFNTENLIHLWSDFLDAYTEYYQSELSPVTFQYESTETVLELPIITHETKNNLNFNSKIWCHRVNSIERLEEAKAHFTGFEIDVVYQKKGWFDVNHPPAKSIGLHLKQLIQSTESPETYNYWLDMKNLDTQNSYNAAKRLYVISKEMNCTENIIVESECIECLPYFDSLGFKTAYYLPFLHDMNEEELAINLTKIDNSLSKFSPSVLSQERDSYALMKKHFPNCNFITWDLQTEATDNEIFSKSKSWAMSEKQLKVLLIRLDSPNHR
jgi:heptose-I-phosphate ethanolaminephosphotransferase